MHSHVFRDTPLSDRPDSGGLDIETTNGPPGPARVIEIGEITAGIAVPEARGVRFFSSARAFDGLDGAVFRTAEQAARAARAKISTRSRLRGA
jgi:hypothetical protein